MSSTNTTDYSKRFFPLLILGVLVSCYLIYHHVEVNGNYSEGPSLCSFGENLDCDKVARSSYAEFFGVPVASLGLSFYLFVITLFLCCKQKNSDFYDSIFFFSSLALLPTLFLAGASFFVIQSVCLFCSVLYLVNVSILFLSYLASDRAAGPIGSFVNGLTESIRYLGTLFRGAGSFARALNAAILAAACGFVLSSSFLLEEFYFIPNRVITEQKQSSGALQVYVRTWKSQPKKKLSVRTGDFSEKDFTIGNPNAKVVIHEFSDFECPFCQGVAPKVKPVFEKYKEEVLFVFKNYPLDQTCNKALPHRGHEFACRAAVMARCAGQQGDDAFWMMTDALFALGTYDSESLLSLPTVLKLDEERFNTCFSREDIFQRTIEDIEEGREVGVAGTPSFYVNGKNIGRIPFQLIAPVLEEIIQSALKEEE